MAILNPSELLDWLEQNQFLTPGQAAVLRPALPGFPEAHGLAKELIRRDWLTPYQVNQILQGNHEQLVLGSYRLRKRLGEGAMGQVFEAWNLRMDRLVAVKTIHKEHLNSGKAFDRFRREMQTAAQLHHANIVLVRDADEANGRPYLVMDLIEGKDLSRLVKEKGPFSPHDAAEYARQAALGLQHAYERGVVHRDIKPGNLLLSFAGSDKAPLVKILDFGLARFESEQANAARLTQIGNIVGTIDYIAPEQAQDAVNADTRADIYGLGCTLYYLLTGKPPFPGNTVVEKIGARLTGEPPRVRDARPDTPPGLADVLLKMMARDPAQRYQTPAEVAEALAPFTQPSVDTAYPPAELAAPGDVPLAVPIMELPPTTIPVALAVPRMASPIPQATPIMATPVLASPVLASPMASIPVALPAPEEPIPVAGLAEPPIEANEDENPFGTASAGAGLDFDEALPKRLKPEPRPQPPKTLWKILAFCGVGVALVFAVSLWALLRNPTPTGPTGSVQFVKVELSSDLMRPGDRKFINVWIKRVDYKGPVTLSVKDSPSGVNIGKQVLHPSADTGYLSLTVSYGIEPIQADLRVIAETNQGVATEQVLPITVSPALKK
jgi:serine/threonine protein kinase